MVVQTSMQSDVYVDDVSMTGESAEAPHHTSGVRVQRRSGDLVGMKEPRQPCLPGTVTPHLSDHTCDHVEVTTVVQGRTQQCADPLVSSLERDQGAAVERETSHPSARRS